MTDMSEAIKDSLYVAVGLGVMGFQQAQVRRRELSTQFEGQLSETGEQLQRLAGELEQRLDPLVERVQELLPESMHDVVSQARQVGRDAQEQLLGHLRGNTATA